MDERTENSLELFTQPTASWFAEIFGAPTQVQQEAWPAIAEGGSVLISAPTGTGKTLSAFLVFIDRLQEMAGKGKLKEELYLIYVSPLKSLAGDIRENLKKPLDGISNTSGGECAGMREYHIMQGNLPALSVHAGEARTGDTAGLESCAGAAANLGVYRTSAQRILCERVIWCPVYKKTGL